MRAHILIAVLIAGPALAEPVKPRLGQQTTTPKAVDCYCTDTARKRLEIGDTTCLFVDGKAFMAQCQMSLNVPIWRKVSDGCQTSGLAQSVKPAG